MISAIRQQSWSAGMRAHVGRPETSRVSSAMNARNVHGCGHFLAPPGTGRAGAAPARPAQRGRTPRRRRSAPSQAGAPACGGSGPAPVAKQARPAQAGGQDPPVGNRLGASLATPSVLATCSPPGCACSRGEHGETRPGGRVCWLKSVANANGAVQDPGKDLFCDFLSLPLATRFCGDARRIVRQFRAGRASRLTRARALSVPQGRRAGQIARLAEQVPQAVSPGVVSRTKGPARARPACPAGRENASTSRYVFGSGGFRTAFVVVDRGVAKDQLNVSERQPRIRCHPVAAVDEDHEVPSWHPSVEVAGKHSPLRRGRPARRKRAQQSQPQRLIPPGRPPALHLRRLQPQPDECSRRMQASC